MSKEIAAPPLRQSRDDASRKKITQPVHLLPIPQNTIVDLPDGRQEHQLTPTEMNAISNITLTSRMIFKWYPIALLLVLVVKILMNA